MSVQLELVGLATDPNAHQGGRRGALRQATDVVIDLPGVARPRPTFDLSTEKTGTSYTPRALARFNSDLWAVSYDGAAWRLERSASTLTGAATPPSYATAPPALFEARKNLYLTTSTGLRKVTSAAATASAAAGLDCAWAPDVDSTPGGTGPFVTGKVAYRFVAVSTDANGYVRRSAPSNRYIASTSVGAAVLWSGVGVYFAGLAAGDIVEGYRTRTAASGPPPPDHFLAWTYTIQASDVTNGYFVPPDDALADDDLGAALYTNPAREGIINGKEPPPVAVAAKWWNGCAWYGNTTSKHRIEVSLLDVGGALATYRTDTGLQCRRFVGDFTTGTNTITNVVAITGLVVGQALADDTVTGGPTAAGTYIPAGTYITNITGAGPYTVTMSKNATGTAAAQDLNACDIVKVAGIEFYAWKGPYYQVPLVATALAQATRCFVVDTSADYQDRIGITTQYLVRAINHYHATNTGTFTVKARILNDADYSAGGGGQIVLEEVGLGGSSFTFKSEQRPKVWSPKPDLTSTNDARVARLWWSDPDEPEAVPLLNYVDLGTAVDPILALTPLASSLLVWKRDGLFRVSGVAPDAWRVDSLDPSLRLLHAACVDTMDGRAYAWTNRGLVEVTESGGIRSLSAGLLDADLGALARYVVDATAYGAWLVCHRSRRLALLAVPSSSGSATSSAVYCWSAATGAFTTWSLGSRCAVYDRVDELLYYARDSGWEVRKDRGPAYDGANYDRTHTISAWTATAGSRSLVVSVASAGAWAPRAGDYIRAVVGGVTYYIRITAVGTGGGNYTLTLDTAYPSGSTTSRQGWEVFTSTLEWQPLSAGSVGVGSLWRELQAHVHGMPSSDGSTVSPSYVTLGARSDILATRRTVSATVTRGASQLSRPVRVGVSRQVGRATHFYPYLSINDPGWAWRLSGLGVVVEPGSEKVRA